MATSKEVMIQRHVYAMDMNEISMKMTTGGTDG